MNRSKIIATCVVLTLAMAACNSEEAEITTTTLDASLLTTTTTSSTTTEAPGTETTETTDPAPDAVESYQVISRTSGESGETLYLLVPPGDYTDVSMENFLGDLLEAETAVAGVEVFDDRAALDAALKPEEERTADELQAIADHHLVSLLNGREVVFRGPMSEYDDFVIGS